MTAADWRKTLKQLEVKPAIKQRFLKHCKPKERKIGIAAKKCERCGRFGAMVSSYQLNICRHCFRKIAEDIGFKKYS